MARTYRYNWGRRAFNAFMKLSISLGLSPKGMRLLSIRGRTTGRTYTTPVKLLERDSWVYLVSPYGERDWVKNAKAGGEVSLRRGKSSETRHVREVEPDEAVPVLAEYWRQNWIVRSYFAAAPEDGEAFRRDATAHPVFRLE